MKNYLLVFVMGLMCLVARAVPADPTPGQVTQPDGTKLTVVLHGDEFFNYLTTEDGYTVVKDAAGYYTYARLDGSNLVASNCIARDNRTAADRAYLAGVPKGLTSPAQVLQGKKLLNRRNELLRGIGHGGHMDYSKFRGLIILINYTDRNFNDYVPSNYDPVDFYEAMINSHDYQGFSLPFGTKIDAMGSVRDYYYDNSFHQFDPHFDILGPVDVPYACTDAHQFRCDSIFFAALEALDPEVDFSQYDTDEDGTADMVFFMVAGHGSDVTANDRDYLWPHMKNFENSPVLDGVNFSLYACSTNMTGEEDEYRINYNNVAGIGTICHEFSHCLGLPDLYDADGEGSGGTNSKHPMTWSVMASGFRSNNGRNPAGYSLFERYALGFAQPTLIDSVGTISIPALEKTNTGYRLNTANDGEYFIIENRQRIKWDKNLAGPGMLIWRIDSTNVDVWEHNLVNSNPTRMYCELLRAKFSGISDSYNDPFPGVANVTTITNITSPYLRTWDGKMSQYAFVNIAQADSIITFDVIEDNSKASIETFERMPVGATLNESNVTGVYAHWNFTNCAVVDTVGNGHTVAMRNGSYISTAENLNKIPKVIRFTVYNPTTAKATFQVYYSKNNGSRWFEADYPGYLEVPAGATATGSVTTVPTSVPVMLRIKQITGSSTDYCFLDNVEVGYESTWEPEFTLGDVNEDNSIDIDDVTLIIASVLNGSSYNPAADMNEDGVVDIDDVTALINIVLGIG